MKPKFFIFLLAGILISGCIDGNVIKNLNPGEFAEVILKEDTFVLDVRMPEEEHIPGTDATIAHDQLELNKDLLPKDKSTPIAVYCKSGRRSALASETLKSLGYSKIYNLKDGKDSWDLQNKNKITVYKSPSCGCCVGYIAELKKEGFNVDVKSMVDTTPLKQQYNIPYNMQSCHTSVIGDYYVEGHVPFEAVRKLLEEKPDIDGIALPDMPSGSPGMPGIKTEPFAVYALSNGEKSMFMEV
jgi:hypothetical protein